MNGDKPGGDQPQPSAAPVQPPGQWQYTPSSGSEAPYQPPVGGQGGGLQSEQAELEWTGSEFIEHGKSPAWFAAFAAVATPATIGAYIITRDILATIMVASITIIFGVAANRPPRTLQYRIVSSGIFIGKQFYPFGAYKSFSIVDEGAFSSIMFWPLKRFSLPIGLYYDPNDEERIVTALANHLPMQQHKVDLVEQIMRRIRF